ncbi:uncharacterized protein LOC132632915 [Lycium barbarum]|uniref:uncharacterized protein LOC132632915 n=1 Tax=Lycium barbarum TaxID=112863 RepID=UPI00293F0DE1|nr:uncharacterized protein LOC132632915 [Lycium barbarum]
MVMADPDKEEEVAITEAQLENLKRWERTRNFQSLSVYSMFAIHKSSSDFAVFPPVNHENLYISTNSVNQTHSQSSSPPLPSSPSLSSSSSFSPSNRDNDDSSYSFAASDSNLVDPPKSIPNSPRAPARVAYNHRGRWWNMGLQVLFSRINGIGIFSRRAVMSIFSPFGMAAMLVMLGYFRWRRRLIREQSKDQLRRTIKAKDERINQLLSQIAEMNQVFVAMHKRNLPNN